MKDEKSSVRLHERLHESWSAHKTPLLKQFESFYRTVQRLHSVGRRRPNQVIQRDESMENGNHSVVFLVLPLGIEVRYTRVPGKSRIDDFAGSVITRIDEQVVVSGSQTEGMRLDDAYLVHQEGGLIINKDDDLLADIERVRTGDVSTLLMRYYGKALTAQGKAGLERRGTFIPIADTVDDVPGVSEIFNLGYVGWLKDSAGKHYPAERFEGIVLDVMLEQYHRMSHHWYDKLFILDNDFLLDCGDHSLLEMIVEGKPSADKGPRAECREAYAECAERMRLYKHDDAVIRIVENIFPESGSVYLCTLPGVSGAVKRIFDFYVFRSKGGERTSVKPGQLRFEDRGLSIYFIGDIAESEFLSMYRKYSGQRELLESARDVDEMLDEFI